MTLVCLCISVFIVACSQDPYETGDSSLSYLKAEMADIHIQEKSVKSIITDEDETLRIADDLTVSDKMARPDTTYRMMIYYNAKAGEEVKLVRTEGVYVMKAAKRNKLQQYKYNPVTLVSAWQSTNSKYYNMNIGIKTGTPDDEKAAQSIGIVQDSVTVSPNGQRYHYLTLAHDQGDIPEYYTQNTYISLPLSSYVKGDSICIRIKTYKGWQTKKFAK